MLNVITACWRPRNLKKLLNSFLEAQKLHPTPIVWWIVYDAKAAPLHKPHFDEVKKKLSSLDSITASFVENDGALRSPSNVAINRIQDGLICWVDDDNIMHPRFLKAINYHSKDDPEIGLLYQQNLGKPPKQTNRRIRTVYPYGIKPGAIDTAQFTIHRKIIGDIRWQQRPDPLVMNPPPYQPDGVFIQQVYERHHSKFKFIKHPICYYNYLSSPKLDFS